ncbi:MAG: PAS domain S-box protein [Ignavibacteriaceae bacterium]|nr:PAS domain S-box protein [Ignavibacteriaceae bacterium]
MNILPKTFLYEDRAEALILINGKEYKSKNYKSSKKKKASLKVDIGQQENYFGYISVEYSLTDKDVESEMFLAEEKELLESISVRIANYLDKKNKEYLLKESEEKYRSVINNVAEVIFTLDKSDRIKFISPSANKFLGYEIESLLGEKITSFFADDYLKSWTKNKSELKEGKNIECELQLVNKSGELVWGRISASPHIEKEKVVGVFGTILNITTKKTLQLKLNEREILYQSILLASPDVITITDLEGKILYASPKAKQLFLTKNEKDFEGRNIIEFIDPSDHQKAMDGITNMFNQKFSGATEYRGIRADGTAFDIEVNGSFIKDINGNIEKMMFITRDITQRKVTEEKLKSTELLFKKMVESINDVIYEVSMDGTIRYVSPAIKNVLGYDPEEIIGKNFFAYMYKEDVPIIVTALRELGSRDYSYLEYRYYAKSGELKWVRSSTAPIIEGGKVVGGRGSLTDINDKKKAEQQLKNSEEELRSLITSQTNYVLRTDLNGKHIYWNNKFEEEFGWIYEKDGITNGDSLSSICDYHHNRTREVVEKCILNPGTIHKVELDKPSREQGIRTTLWEFVCLTDADKNPIGIQCMGLDITDRKIVEEKLVYSEKNYKNLFYNSPEPYLLILDGIFIECNKASELLIGGKREDIIGKSPDQISPEYQPNGIKSIDYAKGLIEETFEKGKNTFEWVHKKVDGHEFLAQINLSVIEYEGLPTLFTTWRDITAQRKAEEQLRKLSRAVDQNPVSIVITNLDGNIEYANAKACETTGYSLDELIGKNPRVLKSGETTSEEYSKLWGSISSGKEWKGIFHNRRKNGELYWESSTIAPIYNANGKITHYLAIKEDISERIRMQEALSVSEQRFSKIAAHSKTVIWEVDVNGLYTYVSDVSESVYGYKPDELVNKKHFYDLFPHEDMDDYKEAGLSTIREGKTLDNFDNPILHKDGHTIWVSSNGTPIRDKNNVIIGFQGADIDINERKNAEEELKKFRTISEQANYGNAIASLEGILLYTNSAFAQMHGYTVEEITNKNLSMLHTEDQMLRVLETIEILKTKGSFTAEEVWRVKKDGTRFPSLMNAVVIFDSDNRPQFLSATVIDITELKEKEDRIQSQNERLNAIMNIMPDMIFVSDGDGNYLEYFHSKSNSSLSDYSELVGKNVRDAFDPETAELHLQRIKKCLEKDEIITYEYPRIENGKKKYFEGRIVKLEEYKVLRFVREITERKESENEIKRLTLAIEQSPVAIVITDLNANIEYVSPAFYDTTGYKPEEVIGNNVSILKSGKTSPEVYAELWNTINSGQSWSGEWINKRKNEELYWESISITPIYNSDGVMSNFLAIKQDISERKKAEQEIFELNTNLEKRIAERTKELEQLNKDMFNEIVVRKEIEKELKNKTSELETFFTVALDLLCIADMEGNFIKVNAAWEVLLGYRKEDLENRKFLEFVHPEDIQGTLDAMLTLSEQNPILKFINRYQTKNGDYRYIEWHSVPVGKFIYAAARDITERKKNEDEILEARAYAERANQAKSEFLSRMSHELRTPMNSILGFAQLLEMGTLNPPQRKSVNHIIRSGKHLLELINEVLDISRIEAGRISLSLEPVELKSVIFEMIDTVNPIANAKNIKVEYICPETQGLFVKSDKQRLKQVLLNLINNSIKYNSEFGEVWIKPELIESQGQENIVRISVKDTGIGISEENLPKVFNPFERIGAENSSEEGTGLGLAVVKKLIDLMGGKIGVESKKGEGSTFWIELPHVISQLEKAQSEGGLDSEVNGVYAKKGTILYIEDNVSNIELIDQVLTSSRPGIKMITNTYGKQAVNLASEYKPDLILLDLNLPDIHGSEVLENLQKNEKVKDIPVVILSADAMQKQLDKLLELGAKDYITKPIDIAHFLEIIDGYLK